MTRNAEVTCFGVGNRGPVGKMGWRAQDGAKPLRKAGAKSKVQFAHRGWSLDSKKKKTPSWKTKNNLFQISLGFTNDLILDFLDRRTPAGMVSFHRFSDPGQSADFLR